MFAPPASSTVLLNDHDSTDTAVQVKAAPSAEQLRVCREQLLKWRSRRFLSPLWDSDPIPIKLRVRAVARVFASLDAVNLNQVFELRARDMRSVPVVLRGRSDQGISARNIERRGAW